MRLQRLQIDDREGANVRYQL